MNIGQGNEILNGKKLPNWVVQGAGFEPAKRLTADLESAPFDHSGTPAIDCRKITWCSFFLFNDIL